VTRPRGVAPRPSPFRAAGGRRIPGQSATWRAGADPPARGPGFAPGPRHGRMPATEPTGAGGQGMPKLGKPAGAGRHKAPTGSSAEGLVMPPGGIARTVIAFACPVGRGRGCLAEPARCGAGARRAGASAARQRPAQARPGRRRSHAPGRPRAPPEPLLEPGEDDPRAHNRREAVPRSPKHPEEKL